MAAGKNLGIADQEFYDAAKCISDYGDALQDRMERYCKCLHTVCELAIRDQKIDSKLSHLSGEVENVRKKVSDISNAAAKKGEKFIKEIDKVDDFLY